MKLLIFTVSFLFGIFTSLNWSNAQTHNQFNKGMAPINMDTYQNKVLSMGYNWHKNGLLSVYTKEKTDTIFTNITEGIDLGLNVNSRVRFDNNGVIWAFGRNNLWKYDQGVWNSVPTSADLLPNRYFKDFSFDSKNNLIVIVEQQFESNRINSQGTTMVYVDSIHYEVLQLSNLTSTIEHTILKKYYAYNNIGNGYPQAITKRIDGSVAVYLSEDTNNVMIVNDGKISYQTSLLGQINNRPFITSMAYDKNMNLWVTVNADPLDKRNYNGLYKFTSSNTFEKWDSANGLAGKDYMKIRYPRTIGVDKVSINNETGIVWCGTEYGFFSVDESKPKNEQIIFYTRDSLDSRYKLYRYGGFFDHNFKISDIQFLGERIYYANPLALIEFGVPEVVSSVQPEYSPQIQMEVYPIPANQGNITLSVKNKGFVNGATISIVDLSGNTLQTIRIENSIGNFEIPLETKQLPSGTYHAVLTNGKDIYTKQFVLVK